MKKKYFFNNNRPSQPNNNNNTGNTNTGTNTPSENTEKKDIQKNRENFNRNQQQNKNNNSQNNQAPNNQSNQNNKNNNRKDQPQKNYRREFINKKHQFRNERNEKDEKNVYQERKKVILGKCMICDANVADEIYSFKIEEKKYIHFECMIREMKNQMRDKFARIKNFKVYYIGNGAFAAVNEKESQGNIQWKIIHKINVKEILAKKEERILTN
ncbi:MAG TPA: hypothetical protein DHW82_00160 [Spirochaetia bacterium]|nr:MAG: hypothetical protein A2Y41_02250 [Spirochaetes bacterium GWB1_36_13]HCL55414.1 hypothetical protein [Spirochaetia bacterium]